MVRLEVTNKSLYETVLPWAKMDFSHFISQTEDRLKSSAVHFELFPVCFFQVVEADIFSANSLKAHFKGQDVIMSCLGFPTSMLSAVTGYSQSMSAVISAMREARVNRIVTMTSWYTERKCCCSVPHRGFFSDLALSALLCTLLYVYIVLLIFSWIFISANKTFYLVPEMY